MPHSVPRQQICTIIWERAVFCKKKGFTRMQIKPKILQGQKQKIIYITG